MKEQTFSPVASSVRLSKAASLACLSLCLLLATAISVSAFSDRKSKAEAAKDNAECDVENFGKVNEHYYRGAQPEARQYEQLATLGIKTIIDLRDDPRGYAKSMRYPRAILSA